jgi:hypothetical protein
VDFSLNDEVTEFLFEKGKREILEVEPKKVKTTSTAVPLHTTKVSYYVIQNNGTGSLSNKVNHIQDCAQIVQHKPGSKKETQKEEEKAPTVCELWLC